jgi:hypothetical protein
VVVVATGAVLVEVVVVPDVVDADDAAYTPLRQSAIAVDSASVAFGVKK